jgi:Uma2 family endonuclease
MRYEEFLAWSDEDVHAEWVPVDNSGMGEVILQMPPKLLHQRLVKFLSRLLDLFVHLFDLGEVALAPFEVKLQPDRSSCEPDIFFVARENLDRLSQERFNGPPDLVIEIVSESSVKRDRSDKYREYQAAGVREYWIIDPREGQQRADFFRLDDQGKYYLFATEENDRVKSQVLHGFWLCPEWLWQVDVLNPLMILGEIRGIPSAQMQRIQDFLIEGIMED